MEDIVSDYETLGNLRDSAQLSGSTQAQYGKCHKAGKIGYAQRIRAFSRPD